MEREQVIVLDTHALIWWVTDSPSLSARARRLIETEVKRRPVVTSAISIFEITTAARRGRLEFTLPVGTWLDTLGQMTALSIEPVSAEIARNAAWFEEVMPGDPADRIIAATTLALGAKLVTTDAKLQKVKQLKVVW